MTADSTDSSLRLGFAGTPDFAATLLAALLRAGRRPAVVYTQPDRPSGRGRRLQPPPVKRLALQEELEVLQPESLRGPGHEETLAAFGLDVLVVAAYGLILPPAILQGPRFGCINVHASLLPRWRGAAPVERAIMAGDAETGVSIMQMDRGLDTGPVYLQKRCPIHAHTDGPTLEANLATLGGQALLECLERLPELCATPQPEAGATYAPKLTQADRAIDWPRPAPHIDRQIRALCGRMPAFTGVDGVRVTILKAGAAEPQSGSGAWASGESPPAPGTLLATTGAGITVACGEGALTVSRLKLSVGKGRTLEAGDAVNGYPHLFAPGVVLESPEAHS